MHQPFNFCVFWWARISVVLLKRGLYNYITCSYSASKQTDLVQRSFRIHFCNTRDVHHSIFTECGEPKEMMDGFSVERESAFFVSVSNSAHVVESENLTDIVLSPITELAFFAIRHVCRNNVISCFHLRNFTSNAFYNPVSPTHFSKIDPWLTNKPHPSLFFIIDMEKLYINII